MTVKLLIEFVLSEELLVLVRQVVVSQKGITCVYDYLLPFEEIVGADCYIVIALKGESLRSFIVKVGNALLVLEVVEEQGLLIEPSPIVPSPILSVSAILHHLHAFDLLSVLLVNGDAKLDLFIVLFRILITRSGRD